MENVDVFKADYKKLQEKYDLPSLDELNSEFEIVDHLISNETYTSYPLRYTRRFIVSIFYNWINYLHNFIMPNPQSAILIRESESFSEEQKLEVTKTIKEIMFINRLSTNLDLEMNEEEDAKFLRKYFDEWKNLKGKLLGFAKNNLDGWLQDMPENKESYFG